MRLFGRISNTVKDFGRKSAIDDSVKDKVQRGAVPLAFFAFFFFYLLSRTSISACKQEKEYTIVVGNHPDVVGEMEAELELRPRTFLSSKLYSRAQSIIHE